MLAQGQTDIKVNDEIVDLKGIVIVQDDVKEVAVMADFGRLVKEREKLGSDYVNDEEDVGKIVDD